MSVNLGINGFGRIGRNVLRASLKNPGIKVCGINDLADVETLAYLIQYDTILGTLQEDIRTEPNALVIGGRRIPVTQHRNPHDIDWARYTEKREATVVLEATGLFTKKSDAAAHLSAGASKVIISAPSADADLTIVLGVNEESYQPRTHHILSNASCTTNCVAPVARILHRHLGIESAIMSTIHSYTADQNLVDSVHKDFRRARAAALNLIPTSTGVAKALADVMPEMAGKFTGKAIRVPTASVSLIDLSVILETATTADDLNKIFLAESLSTSLKNIIALNTKPLVSSDFSGNPASAIIDAPYTTVSSNGKFIQIMAWYDNEWGYANRCIDLAMMIAPK